MSYDTNMTILLGRLTKDPETGFTQNNTQYTKFSIANNQGKNDDPNAVNYFDITAWQKTAEICAKYLSKGSQVIVTGKLAQDRFTDKSGQNRSKVSITAREVTFVGSKNDGQQGQQQSGYGQQQQNQQAQYSQQQSFEQQAHFQNEAGDDIPF